ncbi:endo-1,4-beta-xylanase [Microbacterium jejuense]|uniref:endo-1,4-beta-xylanase n=1 Tax=Microbacterium jejuense TaxID=1263637 RepID=UPI0031F0E7DD
MHRRRILPMIAVAAATAVTAVLGLAAPAAAAPTTVSAVDFEDGTTGPWGARGGVTLTVTDAEAHGGAKSLAVTGRTANWQGLSASSAGLLAVGSVYQVSAWVKLPAGTTGTSGIHFTAEQTPTTGSTTYSWIGGAVETTAGGWVQIGGAYTMPAGMTSVNVYIEAAAIGDQNPSFLVDDIVITTESGGAVPDPDFVPGGAINPVPAPVSLADGTGDVAALTFDDGPNPGTTPALLDYLAEKHLTAVFCVIGQNIQAPGGAAILQRIVNEGHTLCNHSTSYADMGSWTAAQIETDLKANLQIIRTALGNPNQAVPFWRAPNGSWGASPAVAVALGMQPLAVVNTISDWETQDVATLTANLRAAMKPGEIVLAHDGGGDRSGTLAAIETVVDERLADGWSFVLPKGAPPVAGEVVIDTDFESGLDGWSLRGGSGSTTATVGLSTATAHGGAQSAVVTGRVGQGDGIGHDITGLLDPDVTYELSAWVRFGDGQPVDDVWLSRANTDGGSTAFATLAQFDSVTNTGWTEVTARFTGSAAAQSLLYFETRWRSGETGNTSDLYIDDVTLRVPAPAVVEDLTGVKETVGFPVGVAIDSRETTGAASELVQRHFDQVTPENFMKPEAWYDANGDFVTENAEADALMDDAQQNGLRVYGHVLAWHSQTPAWFFQDDAGQPLAADDAGRAVLSERLRTHVFDVAQYLSDRYGLFGSDTNPLRAFDVVNEVVSDGGESADGLRRSEWYRILGEEFIDQAFAYAEEAFNRTYAAPGADRPVALFINDYNTEQGGKQQRYHALVQRLLARGVPVDGVGHQFHVSLAMPVSALEAAITAFEDLPVTQAVTEFDVTTGTPVTQAKLVDQGYYYRDAFRVFRAHADDLYSVTLWGLTDGRSWRNSSGAPLLFDDGYKAKPAYYGAVDGELAAPLRTANVFAGDVALDAAATSSPEWKRLPLHRVEGTASFQLRWAADHLTVYASVDDASADAADGVELALGDAVLRVARDGTGDVPAVVTERAGGYDVVAHLPLTAAAAGATLAFDLRVATGAGTVAWNAAGTLGTLTLVEPLSFLEVVQTDSAPVVDGTVDAAWAEARAVTTDKAVSGSAGAVATVRTLWSGSTLYVLAEVADPTIDVSGSDPWVQDSVEVYVDPGNAKNGSYRYDDSQIRVSAANAVSFGTGDEAFQRGRVRSATSLVDGGYVVELAIELGDAAGPGTFHGLDFQVNDASGGQRTAIGNWADPTGAGYQSTARWGVGELVGTAGPVNTVAPSVSGLAAVNGKLVATPGEWRGDGLTYTYRWQLDGVDIPGATRALYPVRGSDRGHAVSVVVTATAADGRTASAASSSVSIPPKPAK